MGADPRRATDWRERAVARLAAVGLASAALASVAAFFAAAPARLASPLEFGAGDGLMLDHVVRVAGGQRLYVEPSLEFIPLAYMPLYVYAVAPLVKLFGAHFWTGRLVSLLATSALLGLVVYAIRRESGRWSLALAGAGLLCMGQGFSRGSFDTFRPDPLMLALAVAGLVVLRHTRGTRGALVSAALLCAAFFTKQHALLFGAAAAAHLAVSDRRRLPVFALALAAGCGGGFLLLTRLLGPWFSFYVYDVPSHWSQFDRGRVLGYLSGDLLGRFAPLGIAALIGGMLPSRPWRGPAGLWWWAGLGGLGTGLLATLDPYAFTHTLMPTFVALVLLGPIALGRLVQELDGPDAGPTLALAGACLLLAAQFVPLLFPLRQMRPTAGGARAAAALDARLRAMPGRVAIPTHGYFAWHAGKGRFLHTLPLDDVVRARGNRLLARDPQFFERLFEPLRHGPNRPVLLCDTTLALVAEASAPLWASVAPGYRLAGSLGPLGEQLRPRIGYRGAPHLVYEPVHDSTSGPVR